MRSSLLDTFNDIYILDLHGDIDKREICEDGTSDKNVFDIKQGVAISLMVKSVEKKQGTKASLYQFDCLGSRESKYNYLNKNSLIDTDWSISAAISPNYLFKLLNSNLLEEYNKGYLIPEIFKINSTGFESGKDAVLTAYTQCELEDKLYHFCTAEPKTVKEEFEIKDGWGLSVFERRETIINDPNYKNRFQKFLFNPFDIRHTFYRKDILKTNSFSAGQHLVYGENFSLVVMRQVSMQNDFSHVFVANIMPNNRAFYSKKGKVSYFPLYIYSGVSDLLSNTENFLGTNFQPDLMKSLCKRLSLKELKKGSGDLINTCGAENIFDYMYSILYSPTYRTRYSNFLKTGFPRIPFTSDVTLFRQLATYGAEMVALHLMKSPKLNNLITKFIENNGNCIVDAGHPKYTNGAVIINKKGDHFIGVPEQVWNFYVGGYQVCQKWLKDRKGRTLTPDDIQHYQRIVVALKETIELMAKIDAAIPEWPIQ